MVGRGTEDRGPISNGRNPKGDNVHRGYASELDSLRNRLHATDADYRAARRDLDEAREERDRLAAVVKRGQLAEQEWADERTRLRRALERIVDQEFAGSSRVIARGALLDPETRGSS